MNALTEQATIAGLSRTETERILQLSGFDVPRTEAADPIAERASRLDSLLLEGIGHIFRNTFTDTLALAEAQGNPDCKRCDNAMRLGLYRKSCPICISRPYCERHVRIHVSTFHMDSPAYQAQMMDITQEFMLKGWMTGYHTREHSHTLTRHNNRKGSRQGPNTGRSAWYGWADHLGLPGASITTWRQGETPEDFKNIQEQIEEFKTLSGLRAYMWAPGSGITMFTAKRTSMDFLPKNPAAPAEEQESVSGFKFNPGKVPAKIGKRAKFATHAEGAFFTPKPSWMPYIHLPDGSSLKVQVRDTRWIGNYKMARGAGDGNGMIRRSKARKLLRLTGIRKNLDSIIGIQPNFMGADFFIKGILLIRPDQEFEPGTDIVVDLDSVSSQLVNEKFTMGKIIPKRLRRKSDTPYVYIEPVMQAETVDEIIGHEEMVQVQQTIARKVDREAYMEALAAQQEQEELAEENEYEQEWDWNKAENPHLRRALSTEFADGMVNIMARTGGIWSSPVAVKRMAGGPHGHWEGKKQKASPMAGRMLSGAKVYLMHYFFAGASAPQPGYARLIYRKPEPQGRIASRREEQKTRLTGICFNKRDSERFESPLDSSDCDDELTLVFMKGLDGKPKVLILKLPMSIDGGVILNINQEDQRKLEEMGYHFYQQTGTHRFPNLHDADASGNPLFPDVLQPREIPDHEKPVWTTQEAEATMSLLYMNRFAHVTGMVTNLSTALYYSRLWDPLTCKCNYSEGVIDRVANGDGDPTAIAEALTAILYYHVQARHKLDSCIVGRVRNMLHAYHMRVAGEDAGPLEILETCAHRDKQAALESDTKWQAKQLNRREFAANGPKEWFSESFNPELVKVMAEAKRERDEAWAERNKADAELRKQIAEEFINEDGEVETHYRPAYRNHERKIQEALNVERARLKERKAMEKAREKLEALPNRQPGSADAVWTILSLQGKAGTKSRYDARTVRPISTYALAALPDGEHLAFAQKGRSTPTIPLRPTQGQEQVEPGRRLVLAKTDKNQWWLMDADTMAPVLRVKADAQAHTDGRLKVTTVGYLPQLEEEPDVTTGETILMVELTPRG